MADSQKHSRIVARAHSNVEGLDLGSEQLPESERRFRALALAALEKERLERATMARMLHDEVAQLLSGAGLQLDILKMDLEWKIPGIATRTTEIQLLLERVVTQIRELSQELNPGIVERSGLQSALDLLVSRYRKDFAGGLRLNYDPSVRPSVAMAVAVERIAEESLANAIRHSGGDHIEVIVKPTHDGFALQVRDDGRGFDYNGARRSARGLGLLMMEFCATKAGLQLSVTGNSAGGSTVRVVAARQDGRKHGSAETD